MPDHNVLIPTLSASETFYPPTDRRTPRCAHHESDAEPIYATCNQRKISRNNGTRLLLPYLPESLVSLRPLVDEFTLQMARLGLVLKDQLHLNAAQIQHLGQQAHEAMKEQRIVYSETTVHSDNSSRIVLLDSYLAPSTGGHPSRRLPCRLVLLPKPSHCPAPEHARKHILVPVPNVVRALCPFLPDFLPPIGSDKVAVVPVVVPAPEIFSLTIKSILYGVSYDVFDALARTPWQRAFANPEVLGEFLTGNGGPGLNRGEAEARSVPVLRIMENIIRISFNYCALGVWDTVVWDRLDQIYAGCMHALALTNIPIARRRLCSWQELQALMQRSQTFGDLYADAVYCCA